MAKFVGMAAALQLALVVLGHFSLDVLNLSGVLGTAISFSVGIAHGAAVPRSYGEATRGGFLLGVVGAAVGGGSAVALGDQTWMVLTFAPLASGVTGVLGSVVGRLARAKD